MTDYVLGDGEPDYILGECTCGEEEFFRSGRPRDCHHTWPYLFDQPHNGRESRVFNTEIVYI